MSAMMHYRPPSPQTPTDAELVARTAAGEREAFSKLVQRYQQSLYAHTRSMGTPHDLTLDLVQEAFVRAFVRIRQCRQREHFRAWLFRIMRNLLIDHSRDIRRREVPLEAASNMPAGDTTSPHDRVALARALRELPELLREAFLLRHDAGYSYEEIAQITDSGVSAVKMRVHRAREQLRAALADDVTHAVPHSSTGAGPTDGME